MFPSERGLEATMFVVRIVEIIEDEDHHISTFGPFENEEDADQFTDVMLLREADNKFPTNTILYCVEQLEFPYTKEIA
jgi:hypothetical protein